MDMPSMADPVGTVMPTIVCGRVLKIRVLHGSGVSGAITPGSDVDQNKKDDASDVEGTAHPPVSAAKHCAHQTMGDARKGKKKKKKEKEVPCRQWIQYSTSTRRMTYVSPASDLAPVLGPHHPRRPVRPKTHTPGTPTRTPIAAPDHPSPTPRAITPTALISASTHARPAGFISQITTHVHDAHGSASRRQGHHSGAIRRAGRIALSNPCTGPQSASAHQKIPLRRCCQWIWGHDNRLGTPPGWIGRIGRRTWGAQSEAKPGVHSRMACHPRGCWGVHVLLK